MPLATGSRTTSSTGTLEHNLMVKQYVILSPVVCDTLDVCPKFMSYCPLRLQHLQAPASAIFGETMHDCDRAAARVNACLRRKAAVMVSSCHVSALEDANYVYTKFVAPFESYTASLNLICANVFLVALLPNQQHTGLVAAVVEEGVGFCFKRHLVPVRTQHSTGNNCILGAEQGADGHRSYTSVTWGWLLNYIVTVPSCNQAIAAAEHCYVLSPNSTELREALAKRHLVEMGME
ncbi:hypothetical protein COO60DRAFT_1642180 [Scenedesmus sp. NREL 46B-D3]|nr:hypothetical protein COO60DRAFT_1642180 [Scenedesmus sp. NREL 46B-D3]